MVERNTTIPCRKDISNRLPHHRLRQPQQSRRSNRSSNAAFLKPHAFSVKSKKSSCQTQCSLSDAPLSSSPPQISRRNLIQTAALVPLYLLSGPCIAESGDDILFTKLPCDEEGCRPVEIHDYRLGTGREVENGSRITVKWTGRLADRYGWPIQKEDADEVSFLVGKDKLIRGFEIALKGMREGGKRRMIIPAELGYRDEQSGPLPASYGDRRRLFATVLNPRRFKRAGDLVIDVQLLKVRTPR